VEGIFFAADGSITLWRLPIQVGGHLWGCLRSRRVLGRCRALRRSLPIARYNRIQRCNSGRFSASGKRGDLVGWSRDLTVDISETLIRVGILRRTEIRLTLPNYVREVSGSRLISSFGDPSIGLKEQIGPLAGALDLSVIIGSGIPLEADKPGRHCCSPFVKFPWSRELPNGWAVGGMQSLFYGSDVPDKLIWESTFYVKREIIKHSDIFVEYGADSDHGRGHARCCTSAMPGELLQDNRSTSTSVSV
jgi:hypothetical protein